MKVKFIVINFIIIFAGIILFNNQISASQDSGLEFKSGIALDAKSGQILYSKNDKEKVSVASMSKLLSLYIVLDKIHSKKLSWNDKVVINDDMENICKSYDYINLNLKSGDRYTVRQLYEASLIDSSNSSILALGNKIAGSNANFVKLMKQKSQDLKIKDAKIYNSCGLENNLLGTMSLKNVAGNADNQFSAFDMAVIAQSLISKYPEVLNTSSRYQYTFKHNGNSINTTNSDQLLKGGNDYDSSLHVDGLKTGTSDGGEDFTGTGMLKKRRIITVIIGAGTDQRYIQTKKLMNSIKQNYKINKISNETISNQTVKVNNAKRQNVKIKFKQNYQYWQPRKIKNNIISKLVVKHNLKAPIEKDEKIGYINFDLIKDKLRYIPGFDHKLDFYVAENVKKANIFCRFWRSITNIF